MIALAIQLTQEQRCCLLICGQPAKLTERLKVEPFPDEESLPLYMSPILVLHTPALAAQGPSTGCRQSYCPCSNIQPPKQQVARRSFLDIKNADFCGLNRCLAELDWSPVLDVDNPDTAVQIWNEILSVAMHKFIPEKQVSTRSQNKPWYSPHLCRIRRQRDRLYTRSKNRTTDHHLSVLYRRVRNWYVAELRYAEKLYYRRISLQRRSSDFQGLFCVNIRKMAQGSNDLSTLPLMLTKIRVSYPF